MHKWIKLYNILYINAKKIYPKPSEENIPERCVQLLRHNSYFTP